MCKKTDKRSDSELRRQIDENLRRVYEQDSTEEIPERFLSLLQKLKEQDQEPKK